MAERLIFLTGHLAEARLHRMLDRLGGDDYACAVINVGVKVAALMTEPILLRRLPRPLAADRVIFPGRAGLDAARLSAAFGVRFERGPEEIADLPGFLGRGGAPPDLSRHDMRIFAEIVDAATLDPPTLLARAAAMAADGADVIDLGCKPGHPFPQMEAAIASLHAAGLRVSVDSGDPADLRRAALAGADFLLSLTEATLDIAAGTAAVPVLIPHPHGDLESLIRAAGAAAARNMPCLLDPILDPVHFGLTAALQRYATLRARLPQAALLMGTGNLTELTDADSGGVTALLLGICSELAIGNLLVVQVSPHTRRSIAEHDAARRMLFAARTDGALPQGYSDALLQLHARAPFAHTPEELAAEAAAVSDANYRIAVAEDGIHVFNNRLHIVREEALACFPALDVASDGAHAFYLGAELAKAEIAWRLGKRYAQDAPLHWGVGAPRGEIGREGLAKAGPTRQRSRSGD